MTHHDFDVRITYADTDRMGVIYYANYLVFFEQGRTELLRALGMRYRDLEEKEGIFLPALSSHVEYLAPGRYDDLLRVRTFVDKMGGATLTFRYEILLAETSKVIARGTTKHAIVNRNWKPVRIPEPLRRLLQPYIPK